MVECVQNHAQFFFPSERRDLEIVAETRPAGARRNHVRDFTRSPTRERGLAFGEPPLTSTTFSSSDLAVQDNGICEYDQYTCRLYSR